MSNKLLDSDPALYGAIMFHGAHALTRLRTLPREQVQNICNEANKINLEQPLHLRQYAAVKQFQIPAYDPGLLSGAQVIAIMVFGLWVLCNEDEKLAGPLLEKWPIKEGVMLALNPNKSNGPDQTTPAVS